MSVLHEMTRKKQEAVKRGRVCVSRLLTSGQRVRGMRREIHCAAACAAAPVSFTP